LIRALWQPVPRRLARAREHRQPVQATRQPGELAERVARAQTILFVCVGHDHTVEIHRRFPQHRHKVYLFGCLNDDAQDVADSVYAPRKTFEACFERIDRGVRRVVEMLPSASRRSVPTGEA
jgi:protein-tyrosine-phosphatase